MHPTSVQSAPRILVIDDNADYRDLMRTILRRRFGADVKTAASGHDGLAIAADAENVDLVICDYWMPDLNGIEVFDRLVRRSSRIPFILCTCNPTESIPHRNQAEFLGVVSKIDLNLMLEKLRHQLKKRQN